MAVASCAYSNVALVGIPLPDAITLSVTEGMSSSAVFNGTVNAAGGATVFFEYGLTNAYGTTVAATPATVTGTTATSVSSTVSGLTPGLTYHYRVVADAPGGTVHGDGMTFTPSNPSSVPSSHSSNPPANPAAPPSTNCRNKPSPSCRSRRSRRPTTTPS